MDCTGVSFCFLLYIVGQTLADAAIQEHILRRQTMENQTILSVENISVRFHVRHRELKAIKCLIRAKKKRNISHRW